MKKIEMIVKEMKKVLKHAKFEDQLLIDTLYDFSGDKVLKEFHNWNEDRDYRLEMGNDWNASKTFLLFYQVELSKDAIVELWNNMNDANRQLFLSEVFRHMLCSFVVYKHPISDFFKKNVVKFFEIDNFIREFENIVFEGNNQVC